MSDRARIAAERALLNGCTATKPPAVTGISAADLAMKDLPMPKCVVNGIIPQGLVVMAGKPKLGKSWWALNVAIATASGGVALGCVEVDPGPVLYLALEDTERRLKDRQRKLFDAQQVAPPEDLTYFVKWRRQDQEGLADLIDYLSAHPGIRMVIIDTWAKFRPAKHRGQEDYQQDYQAASELKSVADKYGVAIVVIHHCRKAAAIDPLEEVNGTLGLTGCADAVLVLRRERGQHNASLFVTGRDIDEQEMAMKWDPTYCHWQIVGDASEFRISQERAEVIDTLRKEGRALKPVEIATALGKDQRAIRRLLWKMKGAGQVIEGGDGRYTPLVSGNGVTGG